MKSRTVDLLLSHHPERRKFAAATTTTAATIVVVVAIGIVVVIANHKMSRSLRNITNLPAELAFPDPFSDHLEIVFHLVACCDNHCVSNIDIIIAAAMIAVLMLFMSLGDRGLLEDAAQFGILLLQVHSQQSRGGGKDGRGHARRRGRRCC